MMGTSDPQSSMFSHINLEQFVTADHPMRKIRPLIDTARIRQLCAPLYAETGRPSIPPEQLFLALLGGYLLGVTSERALVREADREPGPPLVCGAGFGSDAVGPLDLLAEPEAALYGEGPARTLV